MGGIACLWKFSVSLMISDKRSLFSHYIFPFKGMKQIITRNNTSRIQLSSCNLNRSQEMFEMKFKCWHQLTHDEEYKK